MRSRSVRTLTTVLTAAVALSGAATAHADLIVNGVDDSVDTTVERMPLDLQTGPGTTTIYVVPAEGDGDPGCNFDGTSETVTVNLVSSNPEVATVSPSSLVLRACGTAGAQAVTVTPVGKGDSTVTTTVAAGTNKTGGTFSILNAKFSVHVSAVPNRPPTLDIVGVEEGGEYPKGTLARPSCVAKDLDDFPDAPHTKTWLAPLTEITGPYEVDNIGTRYAMCSYVDDSGVQVLARKGYAIIDDSAPVIQRVLGPEADGAGWYRSDVSLDYTIFENQSPSSLQTPVGCEPVTVKHDTRLETYTCSATSAGGTRTVVTNIRKDGTAPEVSPTSTVASGTLGSNGWYTTPVGVTFTATDPTSSFLTAAGTVSTTSSQTVTTSADGELVVASPAFTDRVGNSSAVGAVKRTVKVDTKAPDAPTASFSVPAGVTGWHTAPVRVTFSAAGDVGSGVASCTAPVTVDVDTTGRTVSGTCTDEAGHTSAAKEVTVKLDRGKPVVTQAAVTTGPTGEDDWYSTAVDVDFTATDDLSGLVTTVQRVRSSGEGAAVVVSSPAFTDRAGNTTAAGVMTKAFKVDLTKPTVALSSRLETSYFFGEVPAAPICVASDAVSGLAGCTVAGYGTAVGTHTITAKATDNAGHTETASHTYTVKPWSTDGFAQPVDMGATVNGVKGGGTVPVKFELFAGSTELTAVDNAAFTATKGSCLAGATVESVDVLTSGTTGLRYDTTSGQYVYNWKTAKGAACYTLTMMAKDGTTTATAKFKTT